MKNIFTLCFVSALCSIFLMACTPERKNPVHIANNATPAALDDSKISSISKRSYDNLVTSLYEELLESDSNLVKLENNIEALQKSTEVVKDTFSKYETKSQNYYSSAANLISQISDSITKKNVMILIEQSKKSYETKKMAITNLINAIDSNEATIQNQHVILQIARTIPMIENYQLQKMPSAKPFIDLKSEQEKIKLNIKKAIMQ